MHKQPIYEGLVKRITIGGIPRNIAIGMGTIAAVLVFGVHLVWSLPFVGLLYVILAWLYKQDSYLLEIIIRHINSKDYYIP